MNMDSSVWLRAVQVLPTFLYYLAYPIMLLLWGVWILLGILLTPFMHCGLAILYVCMVPFRILAKFEALYYFLGSALLLGGATGLLLCITHRSIGHALGLTDNPKIVSKKFKRSWSKDFVTKIEEQPDSVITETNAVQFDNHLSNPKANNRFTLSEIFADWVGQDDYMTPKDGELISTIIEEDDDNQGY